LSRRLGLDQPFYGLELHRGDGKPVPHTQVEAIAAHYVHELRTVQPQGPYFLGGYSFGGIVAFEMAQQLMKEGQVGFLALLDPPHLGSSKSSSPVVLNNGQGSGIRSEVRRHLNRVAQLRLNEKLAYVLVRVSALTKARIKNWVTSLVRIANRIAFRMYLAASRPLPQSLQTPYILHVYEQARRNYVPKTYPGHAIYFKSEEGAGDLLDWHGLFAGGLEVYDVPGNHYEIIIKRQHALLWVEKLKNRLQKAQAVAGNSESSVSVSEPDKKHPATA
jgi:thioesterase domain-containing protein